MKKMLPGICFAIACLFCCSQALAAPWGIVATQQAYDDDNSSESIHTINLGTDPPKVYGPFLQGELTADNETGSGVFDIVMLRGNRKALVSTFGNNKIHLIDLKDPKNPVWLNSLTLDFFAEDIAITRNGKLALVTDGGFTAAVAFINLEDFTLTGTYDLSDNKTKDVYANAVAIGPDNMVLFADYFQGFIHYGKINRTNDGFESINSIMLCDGEVKDGDNCTSGKLGQPVNVTISPNGKTALVADAVGGVINVLEIKRSGEVVPGEPFFLDGLPGGPIDNSTGGQQSIAFQNNFRAYVVSQRKSIEDPDNDTKMIDQPNQLTQIRITGPGKAEIGKKEAITLINSPTSQLFGVDTVSIFWWHALAGNASLSIGDPELNPNFNSVSYVNFLTGEVTPIKLNNNGAAAGVAIKPW